MLATAGLLAPHRMSINTYLVGMVQARHYSSGPIHLQHGDGGHSINQYEVLRFATAVATNNNTGNAMRVSNNRDRHEGLQTACTLYKKLRMH